VRLLAALLAAALLAAPAAARADGDPASDVLIKDRVFFPYYEKLPKASTQALTATIAKAKAAGYPVRVALIAHVYDLGSAGLLYRKPQSYAQFLAQELAQFNADWLLVVMPNGYGIYHCVAKRGVGPCESALPTAADKRRLASLPAPGRDLAAAGDTAVRRLAELHGADLGGSPLAPIAVAAAVLLAAGGAALALLRRRRRTRA
jgi:hypothetical protein